VRSKKSTDVVKEGGLLFGGRQKKKERKKKGMVQFHDNSFDPERGKKGVSPFPSGAEALQTEGGEGTTSQF